MTQARSTIAIVGGGCSAWTVALALARSLSSDKRIVVIDVESRRESISPIESTPFTAADFYCYLNVPERELIKSTHSSYTLANRYIGWGSQRPDGSYRDYYMSYSSHGFVLQGFDFATHAIRHKIQGDKTDYDAYSLSSVAAGLGRFRHPSSMDRSLYSTLSYGLQLNTEAYRNLLRAMATASGVDWVRAGSLLGKVSPDSGAILSLQPRETDGGSVLPQVTADLYIDCSGYPGALVDDILQLEYVCHRSQLKVDRVYRVLCPDNGVQAPFVSFRPAPYGWCRKLSAQNRTLMEYYFDSDHVSDDRVLHEAGEGIGVSEAVHAQFYPYATGSRRSSWYQNCVAIGQSAGTIGPFFGGDLQLLQNSVMRLLQLFPSFRSGYHATAREYNRLAEAEYRNGMDFHALHHVLGSEYDTDFWRQCRAGDGPVELVEKMEIFACSGKFPRIESEGVTSDNWISLLLGHDVWPHSYDPLIEQVPVGWSAQQLQRIRSTIGSAARDMPMLGDYLASYQNNNPA